MMNDEMTHQLCVFLKKEMGMAVQAASDKDSQQLD